MPRFQRTNIVSSVAFNGTTTNIAYAGAGVTGFDTASSFSGWVRIASGSTTVRILVARWGDGSSNRAAICFQQSSPLGTENYALQAGYWNGSSYTVSGTTRVPVNTWFHVAFTWDGATARSYINGVLLTGTSSSPASGVTTGLNLGNQSGAFFIGNQTRTKLWTRVLTQEEITLLATLRDSEVSRTSLWLDWGFEEGLGSTVTDSSGNSRTGTITSGTYVYDSPAKPSNIQRNANASIFINGTDGAAGNALSIANNASLSPTAAVTLELWFRPTALKAGILFDNSTVGTTNSYFLSMGADGSMNWFSTIGGLSKTIVGTAKKAKFFEWNCVSATYNGSAVLIFLNGSQLAETLAASGALGTNSGPLRIGAYYSGGISATFLGNLSQPRVYAAGCTLAEHQDRYYRSITSTALQAGLVLDLNTQLGAGSTVTDLSGLGNHATMGASASWTSDSPFKSRKPSVNANMVKNGDFEYAPPFTAATTTASRYIDGSAGGSTTNDLFGWAIESNGSAGTFSAQYDSSSPYAGSYSMKISTLAIASAISVRSIRNSSTTADILRNGIPVTPNTTYNVSFVMRTNLVSGSATSGAFLRINHFNSAGSSVTSTDSTKVQTTTGQTVYTFQLTTGTATTLLIPNMQVVGNDGAATLIMDAYFDNVTITPVYPEGRVPANGNLVKNFDFEVAPTFVAATGTTQRWIDGTSGGSTTNNTYKWGIVGGGTFAGQFDSSVSHSGLYSMKLSSLAVASQCSMTNTRTTNFSDTAVYGIRVSPNTSYTMTGWMKTNYVSGDATNGAALAVSERDAAGAGVVTNVGTYVKTTTDWTLYTVTFTTAANTVYLAFDHRVYGHQGTATLIMDAWFDDIYLAPTTNPGRVAIT